MMMVMMMKVFSWSPPIWVQADSGLRRVRTLLAEACCLCFVAAACFPSLFALLCPTLCVPLCDFFFFFAGWQAGRPDGLGWARLRIACSLCSLHGTSHWRASNRLNHVHPTFFSRLGSVALLDMTAKVEAARFGWHAREGSDTFWSTEFWPVPQVKHNQHLSTRTLDHPLHRLDASEPPPFEAWRYHLELLSPSALALKPLASYLLVYWLAYLLPPHLTDQPWSQNQHQTRSNHPPFPRSIQSHLPASLLSQCHSCSLHPPSPPSRQPQPRARKGPSTMSPLTSL